MVGCWKREHRIPRGRTRYVGTGEKERRVVDYEIGPSFLVQANRLSHEVRHRQI